MRAKGKRILVVDDEVPIQRILRRNLTMSGYEVLVADDGKQAVEMARLHQPDLILLDLNMPGMLGLQVLKELRGSPQYAMIPIIVLTTSVREKDKRTAYELGVSCFLQKPQSYAGFVQLTTAILLLWFDFQ